MSEDVTPFKVRPTKAARVGAHTATCVHWCDGIRDARVPGDFDGGTRLEWRVDGRWGPADGYEVA